MVQICPRFRRKLALNLAAAVPLAHRVVVSVELTGRARVEGDRLDRLVLGILEPRENLEHLVLPDIDGHRNRDARLIEVFGIPRLAHPMSRRREHVIRDALHIVPGIQNDRPGRSVESNPLKVLAIQTRGHVLLRELNKGKGAMDQGLQNGPIQGNSRDNSREAVETTSCRSEDFHIL